MEAFLLLLTLALIVIAGVIFGVLLVGGLMLGGVAALQVGLDSPEPPLELD